MAGTNDDAAAEFTSEFESDSLAVVARRGDTVVRRSGYWTPAVHALLRHLEEIGFPESIRVRGLDDEGNELVSYIAGVSGMGAWAKVVPETGLVEFARLVRRYHDAIAGWTPDPHLPWLTEHRAMRPDEIVTHGDLGPWNTVWLGDRIVGLLDWDQAGPRTAMHDVAYALEYAVPFRDDGECLDWLGYPEPPDRGRRMRVFADAYGLDSTDGLFEAVLAEQEQTRDSHVALAERGMEPHATWIREGFVTAQQHRIDWTRANRALFA